MRFSVRSLLASLAIAFAVTACSDGGDPVEPSGTPAAVTKTSTDPQNGTVATGVSSKPAVKVVDADGDAVSGVTVTFAVTGGGGSVTGSSVTTNASGIATVGSWTLGNSPGANTMTATVTGTGITGNPVTFTATAAAGVAKTMTKQAGDAQNGTVNTIVAIPPAVKLVDQQNNPVAGVSVTFAVATGGGSITGGTTTTNASGIATIGSWTLGAAAGANTLTATATGTGITGNPATFTATSTGAAAFNPTSNTSLTGTQTYSSVNIPAGVTVTATGDLTINVTGAATIAGSIVGTCVNMTVISDGALTLSGVLNNGCVAPPANVPAILLAGKGGYNLNGGSITAAGAVTVVDDPTATDADFPALVAGGPAALRSGGGSAGVPCTVGSFTGTTNPVIMTPNNVDGSPDGTDGGHAKPWKLWCKGGGDISVGILILTGQHGGNGGAGTHTSPTAGLSRGGRGGDGGAVNIQTKGNLTIGAGSVINTGRGGNGGSATATGTGNGGNTGASATATAGNGATPGLFNATATGSITISGGITLNIGSAGFGGAATAVAGDGHNAPGCPAAAGGPAIAVAGNGGSTPDKKLTAGGAVTGLNNITVTGGAAGAGGNASATGGKGGDGDVTCKDGGNGGVPRARGGDGGNADLRNAAGTKIANGGTGGNMLAMRGNGGNGWSDCILPNFVPGGKGGNGANSEGANGTGGTGFQTGVVGSATFNNVSNGGNGGNGIAPADGGTKGQNSAILTGTAAATVNPAFTDGIAGLMCVGTFTKTTFVDPATSDLSVHEPVLLQVGSRTTTVTTNSGSPSVMTVTGLFNNGTITMTGNRTGNTFALSGSGTISTTGGPRNITATFNGTIGANGITGTLSILVAGFPNPAVYPVRMP